MKINAKYIWLLIGFAAFALGAVGVVLPLLPTTPFLLLAAFAFARSSERLSNWLINHRTFGPPIDNWRQDGSIDRKSKWLAMIVIIPSPFITWWMDVPLWVLVCQVLLLSAVAIFILTRPLPDEQRA